MFRGWKSADGDLWGGAVITSPRLIGSCGGMGSWGVWPPSWGVWPPVPKPLERSTQSKHESDCWRVNENGPLPGEAMPERMPVDASPLRVRGSGWEGPRRESDGCKSWRAVRRGQASDVRGVCVPHRVPPSAVVPGE